MNGEYSLDKVICFAVGSKLMIFSQAQSEKFLKTHDFAFIELGMNLFSKYYLSI